MTGEPVQSTEFSGSEVITIDSPPEVSQRNCGQEQIYISNEPSKPRKYYVNGVEVKVLNERVQMFDKDGKLITQSLKDYTKQKANAQLKSLDDFLQKSRNLD